MTNRMIKRPEEYIIYSDIGYKLYTYTYIYIYIYILIYIYKFIIHYHLQLLHVQSRILFT